MTYDSSTVDSDDDTESCSYNEFDTKHCASSPSPSSASSPTKRMHQRHTKAQSTARTLRKRSLAEEDKTVDEPPRKKRKKETPSIKPEPLNQISTPERGSSDKLNIAQSQEPKCESQSMEVDDAPSSQQQSNVPASPHIQGNVTSETQESTEEVDYDDFVEESVAEPPSQLPKSSACITSEKILNSDDLFPKDTNTPLSAVFTVVPYNFDDPLHNVLYGTLYYAMIAGRPMLLPFTDGDVGLDSDFGSTLQ